jgi:hypothetical protein
VAPQVSTLGLLGKLRAEVIALIIGGIGLFENFKLW